MPVIFWVRISALISMWAEPYLRHLSPLGITYSCIWSASPSALIPLTWIALLSIPGIALLFVNGFWVIIVLAFICARFRDVELIVRNLLQIAFLVTPVFWNYQQIAPNQRFMVDYNLFFHFLQIIRLPLLGEIPPARTYLIVIATTLLGYAAAAVVYYRMRRRLAFFV